MIVYKTMNNPRLSSYETFLFGIFIIKLNPWVKKLREFNYTPRYHEFVATQAIHKPVPTEKYTFTLQILIFNAKSYPFATEEYIFASFCQ